MRIRFKSVTGEDCVLTIVRNGDYWVVCADCPPSAKPMNCARGRDLALALRWVLPCHPYYKPIFDRLRAYTEVNPCA